MAYSEALAERVRVHLRRRTGLVEKKMFGGVGWLLNGNMSVGVYRDDLIVRLDHAAAASALRRKHVRVFDITGKAMKGWILVQPAGTHGTALGRWVDAGVAYAATLPAK